MGFTAIPNLTAVTTAGQNSTANAPTAQPPKPPQPPANTPNDTVQLTEAERVYQLYNQGQQVPQIAGALSLSEAAVNSYLNISNSNAA
jgi:DNA-binding NarL/FixJ family response regulator